VTQPFPPAALRRASYVALAVACVHVVFGAIVRISGRGMGCADAWPKCRHPDGNTYWFPPFDHPQIVIEWTHRLLAVLLLAAVAALVALAWRRRAEARAAGAPAVLPPAATALGLGVLAAVFGAVTVFLENPAWATAVHKVIAASLLAAVVAATVRAGGLGAARLAAERARGALATAKTARGALVAAGLTLMTILMGAFTAKTPDAAVACKGFPLCGAGSLGGGPQHVQLTHRVLAYLLVLHLVGLAIAVARRREAGTLVVAARLALGVALVQVVLAVGMLHTNFTVAAVRSMHQATGMALWLVTFATWYLARSAGDGREARAARPAAPLASRLSPLGGDATP
jgi:heme A synthase